MMAKYLPDYGWEPFVLTRGLAREEWSHQAEMQVTGLPAPDHVTRIPYSREDERSYLQSRTLPGKMRDFFCPEEAHPPGMARAMALCLDELLQDYKPDILWATSPTLAPLKAAKVVAERRGIPWVADFRDISQQEAGADTSLRASFLRWRVIVRQPSLVASAAAVVAVSKSHAETLSRHLRRPVDVIYNGYDHAMFRRSAPRATARFTIVYVGRILDTWLRDPGPFFEGMSMLVQSGRLPSDEVSVDLYGVEPDIVRPLIEGKACSKVVTIHPRIDYTQVPVVLENANVCLLLTNRGRGGILTTKFFEYMALGRPILCVPGDGGELDELLAEKKVGVSCADSRAVAETIMGWYREWKSTGGVLAPVSSEPVEFFSRKSQAGILAGILDKALDGRTC